jgi:nicotinate-nucleotide adenylyltransferase
MIKRGIFGGTFDPIHWGHLKIAQAALLTHSLPEIIWVPQLLPPHKTPQTTIAQRWAMVELAIAPHPQFCLPANLAQWQGNFFRHPDYAIDTFCLLQKLYPASKWFWILGLDSFVTLPRWKGRAELIPECHWLVAARNLQDHEQLETVALKLHAQGIEISWELLPMEAIDISSSLIRQTCQGNEPLDHLLPTPVWEYIIQNHLYSG